MGNPYNESEFIRGLGATADHKTGNLTAVAATVALTEGWWKVSADQDYWWRGPDSASTAVTTATGVHEWAKDTPPLIHVAHGVTKYVSVLRVATSGSYYMDRVKGP